MTAPESPSALLLRAADQLDGLAGAATKGPWAALHWADGTHRVFGGPSPMPGQATDNRTVCLDGGYPAGWPADVVNPAVDMDYIAAVDPLAGRDFAAMLRAAAAMADEPWADEEVAVIRTAMDAARKILGEGAR